MTTPLHDVLLNASKQGATDVHYVVGSPPIMRLGDEFLPVSGAGVTTPADAAALVAALLPPGREERYRTERQVVSTFTFPDGLRCRYRVFAERGVPALSLHLLSVQVPTVPGLHLPKSIERFAELRRGFLLLGGPYGSGRTSTATAMLEQINRTRAERIVTVEQSIEYPLDAAKSLVEQQEVGTDTPSYEAALRQALDDDSTVVMVDDVPNAAALALLVELAASRFVLATVTATTAAKALEQLLSVASSSAIADVRSALADVLEGVVVLRVCPRVGGGRVIVAEVLVGTSPVRAIVRDGKFSQLTSIIQMSRGEGMVSLDQALVEAVHRGEISAEQAERQAVDRDSLRTLLKRSAA